MSLQKLLKIIQDNPKLPFEVFADAMELSDLFRGGTLFQQYVVDAWASIGDRKLHCVRNHQMKIRSDLYNGLRDAFRHNPDVDLGQRGKCIILPATQPSSTCHMYQLFQDSMAIARHCGKPNIFITMITNPNWSEVEQNLFTYDDDNDLDDSSKTQTASDHPKIIACVFVQKMKAMIKDIKNGMFGGVLGFVFTFEFQKCDLPHIHLLFMRGPFKIYDATHVNTIVSTEIPDPVAHPMLYSTVTKCMMHCPCNYEFPYAPCMVEGKCSKHYPKEFCPQTHFGQDGYPEYARHENGRTYTNHKGHTFDNHNVIPYNAYLSARYYFHINVKICTSSKVIEYIYKYIYKGHDCAIVAIGEDIDEILDHISGH